MLPDAALKSMKVMFATPCYISAVNMHYVASIFELTLHSARFGLECILHLHSDSLITRGCNKMALKFLEDETLTHLFLIDSDIAFTPQSACRRPRRGSSSKIAMRSIRSIRSDTGASRSAPMQTPTASSRWPRRRPAICASGAASSRT
jgi:hypothetical protein